MPQFTFNATDAMGNAVEGKLDASDLALAAEQVKRMGYTPVRVLSLAPQNGAGDYAVAGDNTMALPATAESSAGSTGQHSAPQPVMPTVFDLTQTITEYPAAANALLVPTLDSQTGSITDTYLEPWQRGGATVDAPLVPTLTETSVDQNNQHIDPTQAMVAGAAGVMAQQQTVRMGTSGVNERAAVPYRPVPYRPGMVSEKSLPQQFKEKILYPIRSGVVLKDLGQFLRQFATLIDAGLPIYQALVSLEGNTQNKKLKEVARAGQAQVMAGGKFSDVMAAYPWIFQPVQIEMVRAAEIGGLLDQVLRNTADYVEQELAVRRMISYETLWPKITLFVAVMVLGYPGFLMKAPAISQLVLGSMGKEIYTIGSYLRDTVGFALAIATPFVLLSIFCRLVLFNTASIRDAYDTFKMAIPGLGSVVRMFAIAKFARTFAFLYRGGFTMGVTLKIAGDACGNGVLRTAAHKAIPVVERGGLASGVMAGCPAFTPMAVDMFRTGETTGNLDLLMDKMADHYEGEGKAAAHRAAMIFGVVVFLILAMLLAKAIIEQYMTMGHNATTLPDEGGG